MDGLNIFNTRACWPKGDIMNSTTCERSSVEELREIVAFAATMYIKRCGRQLLEKCWSV